MEIISTITNRSGQTFDVVYRDVDDVGVLDTKQVRGVHAYCFCGDELVVVYADKKGIWTPPGGGVEAGETVEAAVVREVLEETNMKVLAQCLIGYQDVDKPTGVYTQTRSVCLVEPLGSFVSDPDGEVTEIALINPKDYKTYFDWGEIGDHIMVRALELKMKLVRELPQ